MHYKHVHRLPLKRIFKAITPYAWIPIALLLCIGTARFCHHQTQGFRITKISNNMDENSVSALCLSQEEIHAIRSLFAYPFRYLGRGKQSFVFLSEDDVHVIKIFNNAHQRKITIFRLLAHIPFLDNWAKAMAERFEYKLEKTFESYRIAFDEMKDRTGLLFTHLQRTDCLPPLMIIDALNICHRLDSNELGFLIQKKAQLVYPALNEMIEAQDIPKAKQAISNLLDLFVWKCRHGIHDSDPLIRTNFGFLDNEVIQIDVGPLSKDFSTQDPERMRQEIYRITTSLKHWLSERSPELVSFLDQELEERL